MIFTLMFIITAFVQGGCSHIPQKESYDFYDANGEKYSTINASEVVKRKYSLRKGPKVVVLAASDFSDRRFLSQMEVFKIFNAEKYNYLYVLASELHRKEHGYNMSKLMAGKFLNGRDFRIVIYKNDGSVLVDSGRFLNKKSFLGYLVD